MRTLFVLFILGVNVNLYAQQDQYSCIDSSQAGELIMFRGKTGYEVAKWDYLEVHMKKKDSAGFLICCPEMLHGFYMGYNDKTLWLDLHYRRIAYTDTAGNSYYQGINYNVYSTTYKLNCQSFNADNVDYIRYSSRWRSTWQDASDVMMVLSGISALIISPVAAMRDGGTNFNYPKYLRWAGWSLAAFGLSMSIKVATQPRMYYMQPK